MLADCGGRGGLEEGSAQPQPEQRSIPRGVPHCHPWGCRDGPLTASSS